MSITRAFILDPKWQGDRTIVDGGSILVKRRLNFGDFSAAATTVNMDTQPGQTWLTTFPAGSVIEGAYIFQVTNWTGGAIASATLSVGTTASPAVYVAATSVFTGAPKPLVGLTQVPGTFVNATTPLSLGTIRVQLIVGGGNANTLTSGKADLFLQLRGASIKST